MAERGSAYAEMNRRWKAACRTILGGEAGELADFGGWLREFLDPMQAGKSSLTGKEVVFGIGEYCQGSRRAALPEIDFHKKSEPLSINDAKDIDSLVRAVRERVCYTGSVVLGNSRFVEGSSNVTDSFFVTDSAFISDCKYIAHTTYARYAEDLFGCNNDAESRLCIRGIETHGLRRCLEAFYTYNCSDAYFCYGCEDCFDTMFCFNCVGKRNLVGNLQLSKEKYLQLKTKLLWEVREELARKKRLPSIIELSGSPKRHFAGRKAEFGRIAKRAAGEAGGRDMRPIEAAFAKTCSVVLGRELGLIGDYEKWLMRHVQPVWEVSSAISGRRFCSTNHQPFSSVPEDCVATRSECIRASEAFALDGQGAERLCLKNAPELLSKIALFGTERRLGNNANLMLCAIGYNSFNCYRGGIFSENKYCGCCFWPRNSEHVFGCNTAFSSSFCIKCHFSNNLARCFECDCCNNCADSFYLHNCENCRDCMFCFNAKNLRYAIGNAWVGREKFAQAKGALLFWLCRQLGRKKNVGLDIYNVGCAARGAPTTAASARISAACATPDAARDYRSSHGERVSRKEAATA